MALFHLVYVSSATERFTDQQLRELLERSRKKNQLAGISGLLLYRDGDFMQVLEGEESDVRSTHARILLDPRHRGSITLLQGPLNERAFSEWSMAFRNLTDPELRKTEGYSEFLNVDWFSDDISRNPNRVIQTLEFFRSRLR